MNAPRCHACGAIVTHPQATACAYCRAPLAHPPAPPHAPTPYGYGQPPGQHAPYGAQPPGQYGQIYGAQQPGYHVQPWATPAVVPQQPWYNKLGGSGGFWGTFWMIRLGLALFILVIVCIGSCVSALSN